MINNLKINNKFYFQAVTTLFFLLVCRLLAMCFIPLNDSTEARYGEIAREMLATGNWVTLFHNYGDPFWAKPPLSTWLSAFSMNFLGVNEFAARFPALLLSIATLGLVWYLAKKRHNSSTATLTTVILASCVDFFINSGSVMTDPALLFCTTLTFTSFWQALTNKNKMWSYLFFVSLGLGLLAKGPIALILTGLPLFIWVLIRRQWRAVWRCFPWRLGTLITFVISFPWYYLAETRTPGFLHYFIVGEHFSRFIESGWTGNKYGYAHIHLYGTIWIYAFAGMLPWSLIGLLWLIKRRKTRSDLCKDRDGWLLFLVLYMVCPLIFFTFAKNIIYTYIFPCLPSFALLYAELWNRSKFEGYSKWFFQLSIFVGICFLAVTAAFVLKPDVVSNSQKPVISIWKKQRVTPHAQLIYWNYKLEYSSQFYSMGQAKSVFNLYDLNYLLSENQEKFLVVSSDYLNQIPTELLVEFQKINTLSILSKKIYVFKKS